MADGVFMSLKTFKGEQQALSEEDTITPRGVITPDEMVELQECIKAVQEVEAEEPELVERLKTIVESDFDDHEIGPDDRWPHSAFSHDNKTSHEVCATCDARCCRVFEVCVYPRDRLWRFRGLIRNASMAPEPGEKETPNLASGFGVFRPNTYTYLKHFDDGDCPFLKGCRCSIYATRPITCQAWFCGRGTEDDAGWRILSDPKDNQRPDGGRRFHSMRKEYDKLREEWRAQEDKEAEEEAEGLQEQKTDQARALRTLWRAEPTS
jgi:Fe-S-cluster containining protein